VSELKVNKVTPATGTQVELEATTVLVDGTLVVPTVNNPTGVAVQHNGSTKIATTSSGVTVTGTVAATAFSGDGSALTGITSTGTGGTSAAGIVQIISDSDNSNGANEDIVFLTGTSNERGRIYRSTGDVRFNTDTLCVDAGNSRVGIEKTNPAYTLDVNGTVGASSAVVSGNLTVDTDVLHVDSGNNRVGIGTATPSQTLHVVGSTELNGNLVVDTNTLVIDSANNRVGIGTASPAVTVDVVGEVRAQSGLLLGATSGASRTLDYYESGSWTPIWTGGMTVVPNTGAGGFIDGRFVRIGKFAHVSLVLNNVTIANPSAGQHGGIPSHLNPAAGRSSSLVAHYGGFSVRDPLFYLSSNGNFQFLMNQASNTWTNTVPLAGSGIYWVINHSFIVA